MVASSGASMTLMKSKRPRVDHCCLTLAPSCSISLLTSRMRDGLFLTVWTPSGVRVVSMMYVGMGGSLPTTGQTCGELPMHLGPGEAILNLCVRGPDPRPGRSGCRHRCRAAVGRRVRRRQARAGVPELRLGAHGRP